MFSLGHIIWIIISLVLICAGCFACFYFKPSLKKVYSIGLIGGVISEIIKYFSVVNIVPTVEPVVNGTNIEWLPTGEYTPYLQLEHFPFELCSLYLFFMLLVLVIKDEKIKKYLYSIMYVSGIIGGLLGILLSSIAGDFNSTVEFFTSFRVYQFFVYHSMVVVLSIYLGHSKESGLRFKDWKKALLALAVFDLPTFYLNSLLSSEVYVDNKIVGVTHRINFFSSYVSPISIITKKSQWVIYLIERAAIIMVLIILLYFILEKGKQKEQIGE